MKNNLLIVALGNPGQEYSQTRHNAGRVVFDRLLENWNFSKMIHSTKLGGSFTTGNLAGMQLKIIYPDTFMNLSGKAVNKILKEEQLTASDLLIVYDEIAFPFGDFKLASSGGAGGHNGMNSIISELGTKEFARLRIGIAPRNWLGKVVRPSGDKLSNYVLGQITRKELLQLEKITDELDKAIKDFIKN